MLLYLTSNKNKDLIDEAVREKDCAVKKLVGKYVLRNFIVKDIRNYSAIRFFIVDAACTKDSVENFCTALKSFQMMFPTKIIVVLSGNEKKQAYIDHLTDAGIENLITEDDPDMATAQLTEYLSEKEQTVQTVWKIKNIRIVVAGVQRRCGTTVTAMNLAFWLSTQGAKVCYAETNTNRHLRAILKICGASADGNHYSFGGVDFYFSGEVDGDYDFIICDCGELKAVTDDFRAADKRLLCGSALPYELLIFKRALSLCVGIAVLPVAIAVPDEMKDYCTELIGIPSLFAECSHALFDENANTALYSEVMKEFMK